MNRMKTLLTILISIGLIACTNSESKEKEFQTNDKLAVFAVNYPLLYFAERIGGEYIELTYPIPNHVDPAYWEPSGTDLKKIQNVDLIIDNGAGYAKWIEKVSLPSSKIINTSKNFEDRYIQVDVSATHSHGSDGEHVHYGYAFTTWLNFQMAALQAEAIMKVLIEKQPQHKEIFTTNFKSLQNDLLSLDSQISATAKKISHTTLFGSHPVYQYLGKAYGLKIISEHWEPGENPNEDQWLDFEENLSINPANLMLWEGAPSESSKTKLLALKVIPVVFNPCANMPSEGNFIDVMRKNILVFEEVSDRP